MRKANFKALQVRAAGIRWILKLSPAQKLHTELNDQTMKWGDLYATDRTNQEGSLAVGLSPPMRY